MATLIQAVAWFGPRLVTGRTAQHDDMARWLVNGCGLAGCQVLSVLNNWRAAILFFNTFGSAVKLPGVGTFTPTAGSDGRIRVWLREPPRREVWELCEGLALREVPELPHVLNADGAFRGEIAHCAKMGTNSLPPPC